jgi:hypothetical protein
LLARERDRWLRDSSRCRREPGSAAATLLRRDAAPLSAAERAVLLEGRVSELLPGADPGARTLLFRTGRKAREDWLELGRACDHHLPAARPLALRLGRPLRALFELPEGTRAFEEADAPAADYLADALRDRGLTRIGGPLVDLFVTPEGDVLLGPGTRLTFYGAADGVDSAPAPPSAAAAGSASTGEPPQPPPMAL